MAFLFNVKQQTGMKSKEYKASQAMSTSSLWMDIEV